MVEALATAEQQAREAKSKKNKVLSDVHTRVDNETNTHNRIKEFQKKPSQDTASFYDDSINIKPENNGKISKAVDTCDAYTSLTPEKYFEEFKIAIPLVNTQWTQTK